MTRTAAQARREQLRLQRLPPPPQPPQPTRPIHYFPLTEGPALCSKCSVNTGLLVCGMKALKGTVAALAQTERRGQKGQLYRGGLDPSATAEGFLIPASNLATQSLAVAACFLAATPPPLPSITTPPPHPPPPPPPSPSQPHSCFSNSTTAKLISWSKGQAPFII